MEVTADIKYIGVNDRKIDLFEGQYDVPNGMAYNSYAIIDGKIAVMDTVDANFTHEWLDNLSAALDGRVSAFAMTDDRRSYLNVETKANGDGTVSLRGYKSGFVIIVY